MYPPFNTPAFKEFSAGAPETIAIAEQMASARLENLPEHVAQTMRGIVTDVNLGQRGQAEELTKFKESMSNRFSTIEDMLALALGTKQRRTSSNRGE